MALVPVNRLAHQLPELRPLLQNNWIELALTATWNIDNSDGLTQTITKCNWNITQANIDKGKTVELMPLGFSVTRVREYMDAAFLVYGQP